MTEQEILERYSTPGLRKHELLRSEKKAHLALGGIVGEAAEIILARLYPEEKRMNPNSDAVPNEEAA